MNFMHVAIFLFVVCSALLVVVSLVTRRESEAKLAGLTFATVESPAPGITAKPDSTPTWRAQQVWLSVLLVALVAAVWLYFRG